MAWYRPLERTDGRFDYVCTNGAGTFPIGFCMVPGIKPFYSLPYSEVSLIVKHAYSEEAWEAEKAKYAEHLHRYHTDGHDTPEAAVQCYREFEVLLHSRRRTDDKAQEKCVICDSWTQHRVLVGSEIPREYPICDGCDVEENVLKVHATR
jgi:hypothetical protein